MLIFILSYFLTFQNNYPLTGNVKLSENTNYKPTVYLIDPQNWTGVASSFVGKVIDSAQLDSKGNFVFKKMPPNPDTHLYELAIQQKGKTFYPNRLENENPNTSNYFPIIYKRGEKIVITTSDTNFQKNFKILKPSKENEAMLKLRDIRQTAHNQFLTKLNLNTRDENKILEDEKALASFRQPLIAFSQETPFLFVSLTAIRWVSIEGNYERVSEFLVSQAERWNKKYPNHSWVKELNQKADRSILPVLVGDVIPNYELPMLKGNIANINDLMGKKLTLLDLWASWCAPCRKENRNYLVPLWDKFHEKGFQIVAFALDSDKNSWENAIQKDGAYRWLHASDLQGDEAKLFKQLRLTSIPANFIIDEKGKVIAKNLYGEELSEFINRYFNQ